MRIVIFGASGGTGRQLVQQALDAGHEVTAFVRDPARITMTHPALHVCQGNVADTRSIVYGVRGQEAALSALGTGSSLAHDAALVHGMSYIIDAMKTHGVRRLIYQSFIGVRESREAAGWVVRHIARHPLKHQIADHEARERLIVASDLDWTIVRPCTLTNGPLTKRYRSGVDIVAASLMPRLSRADVACFMLEQLTDSRYVRGKPRVLP
jgi:putative NADH-flavin reductase